ncbi:hypothetical protein EIP86_008666 [Pleurotus ostreatoroseus]|nr:hypothetical protein EIP86_008666 [Pleurotus ostreatoroseus]
MYIAGLDIDVHAILRRSPVSHNQGVEGLMWLTTLAGVVRAARRLHSARGHCRHHAGADTETGIAAPRAHHGAHPAPLALRVLSPLAHAATVLTPAVYLVSTALERMEQPEWFADCALPDHELTQGRFALLRVAAALANLGLLSFAKRIRAARDASARILLSLKFIGCNLTRDLLVIRHPVSSVLLFTQATYAVMWWNWIPVASFVLTGAYLAVALPHEETIAEDDILTGAQYTTYKKTVQYRLIPYVW